MGQQQVKVNYFWDYDNTAVGVDRIANVMENLQKKFGKGSFDIVGNERVHKIRRCVSRLRNVDYKDTCGRNKNDEMLKKLITDTDWSDGDKIVLITGDGDFQDVLVDLKEKKKDGIRVRSVIVHQTISKKLRRHADKTCPLDSFEERRSSSRLFCCCMARQ
uniref:NYN domain-containing protein n=1 Tax=Plectus sambesii TaxID=2011161 RepID=A0A914V997_9BILA